MCESARVPARHNVVSGVHQSRGMDENIPHPRIVSRDQWLAERKRLLTQEKELTRHYDGVNAERRRLPMVRIDKDYVFDGSKWSGGSAGSL